MHSWLLFSIVIAYLGVLFYIAFVSDRGRLRLGRRASAITYALSLAVYCTSWTFFGAVGTTVQSGWAFLPIYLGPVLVLLFLAGPIRRIIQITRDQNLTSIADFLAARYGRSRPVAVIATLISLLAVVPYLALQLKAIDASFTILSPMTLPSGLDQAFIIALVMAAFAVLFGARHVSNVERQHGLVNAVAFESLVKFIALGVVGLISIWLIVSRPDVTWKSITALQQSPGSIHGQFGSSFWISTLLAGCAIICLPRQFHLGVVECPDKSALQTARILLPLYFLGLTLFIVPIAIAGTQVLDSQLNPDTYVLALPLSQNSQGIAILAYLGGLSAASAMIIVSTVALSIMISNELIVPFMLRRRIAHRAHSPRMDLLILRVRRIMILGTMIFAYLFYNLFGNSGQLASYGLVSFAAIAQLAPALFIAVLWRSANAKAVITGMLAGIALWAYCILLPTILPPDTAWISRGLLGLNWLRPQSLFGTGFADALTHGVCWSLGANIACIFAGSLISRQRLSERLQAEVFLGKDTETTTDKPAPASPLSYGDVELLLERFLGREPAEAAMLRYEEEHAGNAAIPAGKAPESLVQHAERELVGAIGSSTAKLVLARAQSPDNLGIKDVADIASMAAQDIRFSRELLSATLENIDQGVSVIDENLRLQAWNPRYLELFEYPPELVKVGTPIEDIIRHNAQRGLCGEGDIEEHVSRRLGYLQQGSPHQFERTRPDGTVIEMRGRPMPGGGFATSFSDITEHKRTQAELSRINASLEKIVEQRTAELAQARDEAQSANLSKTQYLRAASHDLLQPLSAARLMTSALREKLADEDNRKTIENIESALTSAEEMISSLAEINRLDARRIPINIETFALQKLFDKLYGEFHPQFARKNIALRFVATDLMVSSDFHLLGRILQNYLSNAYRYTDSGKVIVGVRRRGGQLEVQVCDSGCGIPEDKRIEVFRDFTRLTQGATHEDGGQGLGLGIVRRLSQLLGHEITFSSQPGRGTCVGVMLPRAANQQPDDLPRSASAASPFPAELVVLCLDNEEAILQGMRELLGGWGIRIITARNRQQVLQLDTPPDLAIVDYLLDDDTGIEVMTTAQAQWQQSLPMILATAERTDEVEQLAKSNNMVLLYKPLKPASLRAALLSLVRRSS